MHPIQPAQVKKLLGKPVFAVKRNGAVVTGKLVRIKGAELYIQPLGKNRKVHTKALLPLVLYDVLAVGGAYGGGYGPYYGVPGYGPYAYGPYRGYGGIGSPGIW